jgi:predicted double-glycine peptidase
LPELNKAGYRPPIRLAWLYAWLGLVWISICPAANDAVISLLEMRRQGVVLQQWDNSCGAAALATVLSYGFKDFVSEKRVAAGLLRLSDPERVRSQGGFSMLEMKRYAEARGFRASGYRNMSIDDISKLRWVIVPIEKRSGEAHFVVVVGIRGRTVELADPAFGRYRASRSRFTKLWRDGLALVIQAR